VIFAFSNPPVYVRKNGAAMFRHILPTEGPSVDELTVSGEHRSPGVATATLCRCGGSAVN